MIDDLDAYIAQLIERRQRNYAEPRQGIVTAFDLTSMSAQVCLQPENIGSTGWLPVAVDWMGNGWGFISPLAVGDQVLIIFQEGDKDSGIIVKRLWDANHTPPTTTAVAGELWLVHQSGSVYKMTNDGNVTLIANATLALSGQTVNVTGENAVNVTAPSVMAGAAGGTYYYLVNSTFMDLFNTHTHDSGAVGPPDQQMTDGNLTSALQGS